MAPMLHELLHIDMVALVQAIGYPGLTTIIYLESGVFFGFFLPGASVLFTAGLLASKGIFNVWVLIPLVTIAAILGDSTGYWFGKKVGVALFKREDSRFFKRAHVDMAREFYDKHGVLAIALARFVPIVRTFAPIIAGVVNMQYRTFLTYNIGGALAWAAGVTFLGYYLGETVPFVSKYITPIILVIILITLIPIAWEFWKKIRFTK